MNSIRPLKEDYFHLQSMKKMHCISVVHNFKPGGTPGEKRSAWSDRCLMLREQMKNEMHWSDHDIELTMTPAVRLLEQADLWKGDMTTLVQFLSADHSTYYTLTYDVGSFTFIDDHYITSPLLPYFEVPTQTSFSSRVVQGITIERDIPFDEQLTRAHKIERALNERNVRRLFVRSDIYEHYNDRIDMVDEYLIRTEENGGQSIMLNKDDWHLEDSILMLARTN